jgi:hypothetical protein
LQVIEACRNDTFTESDNWQYELGLIYNPSYSELIGLNLISVVNKAITYYTEDTRFSSEEYDQMSTDQKLRKHFELF